MNLQRTAASAMKPSASGRSLSTTLLVNGDETWRATAAPVVRWAKEVWQASLTPHPWGFTLPELLKLWESARPAECVSWRSCRGPLAACHLSLRRLGWSAAGPFRLVNDLGDELILTERSPGLISLDIMESARRCLERLVAFKLCDPVLVGRRAFVSPVVKLLRTADHELDEWGKGVLKSVVCNSV